MLASYLVTHVTEQLQMDAIRLRKISKSNNNHYSGLVGQKIRRTMMITQRFYFTDHTPKGIR